MILNSDDLNNIKIRSYCDNGKESESIISTDKKTVLIRDKDVDENGIIQVVESSNDSTNFDKILSESKMLIPTNTPIVKQTPTQTVTPMPTITPTATNTVSTTPSPSTSTPTVTKSTSTPTSVTTAMPTKTLSVTNTVIPTITPSITPTATSTLIVSNSTPTANTVTPTATSTKIPTPVNTATKAYTTTPTVTKTTNTQTATKMPTPTAANTITPTSTPTITVTPTTTSTVTITPTATSLPKTNNITNQNGTTNTVTNTPTSTPTPTTTISPTDQVKVTERPVEEVPGGGLFSDAINHWAKEYIVTLYSKGIIIGYPDGTIKPGNNITRAEVAIILAKAIGIEDQMTNQSNFRDISDAPKSAIPYINALAEKGILKGYLDGSFKPNNKITRSEFVTTIVRVYNIKVSLNKTKFADYNNIPGWASEYIAAALENDIIKGYPDGSFKPQQTINRGEAFCVLANCIRAFKKN